MHRSERTRRHPLQEDHGPVRYGPPAPEDGLPVLPELAGVLAAAAARARPEPTGGGPSCWRPRAATGSGAACTRAGPRGRRPRAPAAAARADRRARRRRPGAAALRRLVGAVRTPVGQTRLPRGDPGRVRRRPGSVRPPGDRAPGARRGRGPRLLVLSVADDPTATVAPPEVLHEACEAAAGEGLHLVSDETWRDTLHAPHDTVLLSPAEMLPDRVTVVTDLAGRLAAAGLARRRRPLPRDGTRRRASRARARRAHRARRPRRRPGRGRRRLRAGRARAGHRADAAAVRLHARVAAAAHARGRRGGRPGPAPAGGPPPLRRPRPAARPRSPRAASATRRSWRTSSPPGSACPRPAATASATNSARCAYGCPPARCSADRRGARGMPHLTRAVGTATRATRVEPCEVGLRRSPRRRSAMGASSMTQTDRVDDRRQHESDAPVDAGSGRPRPVRDPVRRRSPNPARWASAGCGRGPSPTG